MIGKLQVAGKKPNNSDFKQRLAWPAILAVPDMGRGYVTPKEVARPVVP